MTESMRHPMTGNEMSGAAAGGLERHAYDVVVIGAGGAGLRAAIAAHDAGARTAIVCKSLLGKAHTVMAEGGIAAAMGNRWPEDNWQVHWRETGSFVCFEAPAVVLATGGIGKSFKVTSNSWEYTGDGHALALRAGASLINMEFVQFHPTGMVWPPSVKGLLVTESVRGDGGILKNSEGKRFMFDYIPEFFKGETADSIEEADRWYTDADNN